jgi:hypothetical protein
MAHLSPAEEFERQQAANGAIAEDRIDLWFRLWFLVQMIFLPFLYGFCEHWDRRGSSWWHESREAWPLLIFAVLGWGLLVITGARAGTLALWNWRLIRRRRLALGLLPWGILFVEALLALLVVR